jgi:amino-acid N-acetyltransferase
VVVEEHARGEGVGTELRVALEATAREGGVEWLFLLTTTAADTTEFAALCPASATCLRKSL